MKQLIFIILAYIIGSINFSIILFKLSGREDPRSSFSGNPGTTNVYRQAGIKWAAIVLLLDIGRAVVLALLVKMNLGIQFIPLICLSLIIGNRYPLFHHFQGGKGVANYLGFVASLTPFFGLLAIVGWGITFLIIRIPFIASLVMVYLLSIGLIIYCKHYSLATIGTLVTMAFIMYNHRTNILDLIKKRRINKEEQHLPVE